MIEGLKPYPEYRESGVPWIGGIPSGWKVVRNGNLFRQRNQTDFGHLPILEVSLRTGVRVRDFSGSARKQVMSDVSKYKLAAKGDVAYNMMRMWQGAVGVAPVDGLVSPAYVVAMPYRETVAEFYSYLFRTQSYRDQVDSYSRGIVKDRNRLYWVDFKRIPSVFPPYDEQSAIVRFLGHAGRRIEAYIRAKGKLIALLNEQKQAMIKRAVTRGLDPDVHLKPSGIPWLGDIPEHWERRKMKFLVVTVGGMTPNKGQKQFWGGRIPWVSPKDMKVREINDSQDHITEAALRQTNISLVEPPAVLIVVRGMILARTFPTAVTTVSVTFNQDMKALIPNKFINSEFLVSLLTGIQREVLDLVEEAGHGTRCLRTDSWENFVLPVPPIPEQQAINGFLRLELADVQTVIARTQREIGLLRDYRTRLITDVVTGQLDVRQAAQHLPDGFDVSSDEFDADDASEDGDLDPVLTEGEGDV